MPRGDGTGPAGMGPMTGRAAGYCAGFLVAGFMNPIPGRGFRGRGRGFGWGRGRGWGRGWRHRMGSGVYGVPVSHGAPFGVPYAPQPSREQEAEALKEQSEYLEATLEDIRKRLAEVEAEPDEKK